MPSSGVRIADLRAIAELGLRGVMMPGNPAVEDYDSLIYDEFWEACVDRNGCLVYLWTTMPPVVCATP